jgi:hypothetical protein
MKGQITINLGKEISIYVKASNLQGTMEGTIQRKYWSEVLNETIEIDSFIRSIKIKEYKLEESKLFIKMDLRKDTGQYHFNLELEKFKCNCAADNCPFHDENTYSAKLGGPDVFTWPSLILSLILSPFTIIYYKLIGY